MNTRKRYQKLIPMFKQSITKLWSKFNRCTTTTTRSKVSSLKQWTRSTPGNQNMKLWSDQRSNSCSNLKKTEKETMPEQVRSRNMRIRTGGLGSNLRLKRWTMKKSSTTCEEPELQMNKKFLISDIVSSSSPARSENTLKSIRNVMIWRWRSAWQLNKSKDWTGF
jgi:hypothetical protein